jgi:hypothetical protein
MNWHKRYIERLYFEFINSRNIPELTRNALAAFLPYCQHSKKLHLLRDIIV